MECLREGLQERALRIQELEMTVTRLETEYPDIANLQAAIESDKVNFLGKDHSVVEYLFLNIYMLYYHQSIYLYLIFLSILFFYASLVFDLLICTVLTYYYYSCMGLYKINQ